MARDPSAIEAEPSSVGDGPSMILCRKRYDVWRARSQCSLEAVHSPIIKLYCTPYENSAIEKATEEVSMRS